jgi:hypothetical protein
MRSRRSAKPVRHSRRQDVVGRVEWLWRASVKHDGTWDAVDGKICSHITWMGTKPTDTPTLFNNCWGYMTDGKRVFHQFTSDKVKSDEGWWSGPSDILKLKAGNAVRPPRLSK